MKKIIYLISISLVFFAMSCEEFTDDYILDGERVTAFVDFNSYDSYDGSIVNEGADTSWFRINAPAFVLEATTINLTFGGDAVYGTDFVVVSYTGDNRDYPTISNASASGFTITISIDHSFEDADQNIFGIVPLTDDASDGDKSLTISISNASTESGMSLRTSRIEGQNSFTLTLKDIDCPSDLAGTYTAVFAGDMGAGSLTMEVFAEEGNGNYSVADFTAGAFGVAIPGIFKDACGNISGESSDYPGFSISGTADEANGTISLSCSYDGGPYYWTIEMTKQ